MTLNLTLSTLVLASALAVLPGPWASRSVLAQGTETLPTAQPVPLHSTVEVSALPAPASDESRPRERPRLRPDPEALAWWKERLAEIPGLAPAAPHAAGDVVPRASAPSAPASIVASFEGLANVTNALITGFSLIPSDANLGVGPQHIFQMVNIVGRITNKSGGNASSFGLGGFFEIDQGFDETDPRVIYDAQSGRWLASYAQFSTGQKSSSIILAVSATSDPTGTFCRYRLGNPTAEDFVQDFPQLGVSADKVVVGYNGFSFAGKGAFLGGGYYVVNKPDLLACNPSAQVVRKAPNPSRLTPYPAQTLDGTTTLFIAVTDPSFITQVLTVLAIDGVPGVSPVTETATALPIRSLTIPPNAAQAGSTILLDTGDDSVLSAALQTNSLWVAGNEACTPTGDAVARSCLRVIEIRTDSMSVRQDMTLSASGQHYYYPALQPDGGGNLQMVFNASSSTDFAGLRITGRLAGDPLNTLQAPTLLRAGGGAQTAASGRMGDYSGAAVDPVDPRKVWVSGEYIRSTASSDWGTFLAELMFPFSPPTLTFGLSKRGAVSTAGLSFRTGDTLQVDLTVSNPGPALVVDAFFGLTLPPASGPGLGCPNHDAVAFLVNNLTAFVLTCLSAPPQSLPPLAQSVTLPANVAPATFVNFFSLLWPAVAPAGTYTVFFFLTPPAAFADGFGPDDLTALTTATVDFAP